jgi:hypothetical protein
VALPKTPKRGSPNIPKFRFLILEVMMSIKHMGLDILKI